MLTEKNKRMIFAPIAGIFEAAIMQPFDTIKVLKQSQQYNGLNDLQKKQGLRYLYKGLTPFMGQMFVKYQLRFTTFELLRGNGKNNYRNFMAGITAGFVESLFITPFELIKTNLQTRGSLTDPFMAIQRITTSNNLMGLYRGFGATCVRQCSNQGSNFATYMFLRDKIIKKDEKPNLGKVVVSGLISGSIGPLLNNPFDVVKTRYMNPAFNDKYNSIGNTITTMIKEEGIKSLWKGVGLRIFRVGGGQAITFTTIEQLSYSFDKYFKH